MLLSSISQLLSSSYSWDAASRLKTVTDSTNSATYDYLANSPLVAHIFFTNSGALRMTTTKQWDLLNRLTSISSANSQPSSPISFSYAYNLANQRTRRTEADSSYWSYLCGALGQVNSGKRYWPNGTPVAGQQFEYGFDDIGNRKATAAGGDQWGSNLRYASYSANNLNQYTSRTVPGAVDILGSAATEATVTVNNLPTYRRGEYFRAQLPLDNSAAAVWASITNLAALQNGASADIVATNIGNAFLPQTPESFAYDPDGNLISDGRWNYSWDAENHLAAVAARTGVGPQISLRFEYDSQSRRIRKQVWGNATWSGNPTNDLRFVSDGWNPIAILDSQSSILQSFTWGLDLSGSLQGAGGVGGLLILWDRSILNSQPSTHLTALDGNGNVVALVNASDGTTTAQYEHGPFGEPLRGTGPMAKANPFRFSTKYQDDETDLLYYGYRYYNASTGRWNSSDPIEEAGGQNIYAFPLSDPVNQVDYLGQAGALSYSTKDKTPGKCGGFNWTIHWKVKKAKSNSSIVQHMQWSFSVFFCPPMQGPVYLNPGLHGMDPNLFSSYWEAWGVQKGATESYSGGGDDNWSLPDMPFGDGTKGTVSIHGDATYYPNVPFPPAGFYTNPGPWGTGFGSYDDPGLSGGSGTVTRTLTATWDCCCDSKDKTTKLTTK